MHLQDISATAFLPLQTSVRHQEYSPLSTPLLLDTPAVMDTVFFVHYNANKPREESLIDKVNGQKDMSLFTERQELTHNCCLRPVFIVGLAGNACSSSNPWWVERSHDDELERIWKEVVVV